MGTQPTFLMDYRTFQKGDVFSEVERIKTAAAPKKAKDLFESFVPVPKDGDFKSLAEGIAIFKFDPETAKSLFNAIGSAVNIAAGVMSVIGIYKSAMDFLTTIGVFDKQSEVDKNVAEILANTQTLIDLAGGQMEDNRKGMVDDWNSVVGRCATARGRVWTSRTFFLLRDLADRVNELDAALDKMLAFNTGNIFFQRAAYKLQPTGFDWTAILPSAFLDRRDHRDAQGGETATPNYKDKHADLREKIWDPGHYLGVLVRAVCERLAATATLEPAFRSTGYDRERLRIIESGLAGFLGNWERALLVANPAAGIDAEGMLHHPFDGAAPDGILIGAVDPVAGYSNLHTFPVLPIQYEKSEFILAASGEGVYDSSKALDPQGSLRAALDAHAALVDQVIHFSGIDNFRKLRAQVEAAARPPRESDFAVVQSIRYRLPNAALIGTEETITLGRLARYAKDPHKVYPATRTIQGGNKQVQFFIPRRGEVSGIQLGYTLRFIDAANGASDLTLVKYDVVTSATGFDAPFPTETVTKTLTLELDVLDCIQTRATTPHEEDVYEAKGRIKGANRVLINPRPKKIHLVVTAIFEPEAEDLGSEQPNRGIVTVVFDPADPNAEPDAAVVKIELLETRLDAGVPPKPDAVVIDRFDVTLVPSTLIVPKQMITDLRDATEAMAKAIDGIHDKFGLEDMTPPDHNDINPKKLRPDRFALRIENSIATIDTRSRMTDLNVDAQPDFILTTAGTQ